MVGERRQSAGLGRRLAVVVALLMAGPAAEAQTLIASQTSGAPGSVNHITTINFVPGADAGGSASGSMSTGQ